MNVKEKLEPLLLKVQKPARYIGGELHSVIKDKADIDFRIALCFPDTYEIGMSHLGLKILYDIINLDPHCWAERVYAPWIDFEKLMREKGLPLYGLESLDSLDEFQAIGFSLQYELSYTNILNMLDLAGIDPRAACRKESDPIVFAGGPCASNPEPLCDFMDLFQIGEGEEVMMEMIALYRKMKAEGTYTKKDFLREAAQIPGIYVPSLYEITYHEDGTIASVTPKDGAPAKVTKRIIQDMSAVRYPETFHRPLYGDGPRPGGAGSHAGLHPRLPLLPGRVYLPPPPGQDPRRPLRAGEAPLRLDRLRRALPLQPFHLRPSPGGGTPEPDYRLHR